MFKVLQFSDLKDILRFILFHIKPYQDFDHPLTYFYKTDLGPCLNLLDNVRCNHDLNQTLKLIIKSHASYILQTETGTVLWIPVLCGETAYCGYTGTRSASSFSGESGHDRYALMFSNGVDTPTTGSTN